MPGTYTQVYIQIVFAVKYREAKISHEWEDQLYKYITGIVTQQSHKLIAINGMPDHIHIFIGMKPSTSLSDLVRDIKRSSTDFIKNEKLTKNFRWQGGFGAFSYSQSHIENVYNYIMNQKIHHKKVTFKDEYMDFLEKFHVEYDEKYLFDWI